MRLLLDTHVFLWWSSDDPRLGAVERDAIGSKDNQVLLSAASVWELAIKQSLGRVQLDQPPSRGVARMGIERLMVTFEHAEATQRLPPVHRDPFDRMLVAQAQIEGLTLVTHDPLVRAYPGVQFLPL